MWTALVGSTPGPRREMLYAMDPVVPEAVTTSPESEGILFAALRVGDWKLVEGMAGRDDWYGEDPSLAWPVDYIMGPDATDYDAIPLSPCGSGKVGDRRDGGGSGSKRRWLFNLKSDPTETMDLSEAEPAKVRELLVRMNQLKEESVEPLSSIDIIGEFFGGRGRGGGLASGPKTLKQAVTTSGSRHPVSDVWDVGTVPGVGAPGGCLVDGEQASMKDPPPRNPSASRSKL